jgi:predicted house-cleaning noncanonical NTP pyrophosphatase (MazG superfamily)
MKLVRDKIPEVIYFNGEIACVHIADDKEYSSLLRQKLREEVDEYLESGATEELADILEVLYALAAVLGLSENSLEELRLEKADARGRFLRRIVWHGSRPRLAQPSQAVADLTLEAPAARLAASAQPMHDLSLFDSSQVVRPIAVVRDGRHRRRRSLPSASARGAGEVDPTGTQLQLSLEVSSR